jgi:hypothetical protein
MGLAQGHGGLMDRVRRVCDLDQARLRPVGHQRTGGKDEGASADFGDLGRNRLWAEKGKEKGSSFLFSESIFVENKIIYK